MDNRVDERLTIRESISKMLPVIVIIGLWLGVRVLFKTDIVTPESGRNVRIAYNIATALKATNVSETNITAMRQSLGQIAGQYGWRSIALNAVIALGYALFGVNAFTTLWLAYLGSLVGLGCVYALARYTAGKQAAYLAALLWTLMPVEIFYASTQLSPVLVFSNCFLGAVLWVLVIPRIRKQIHRLLLRLGGLLFLLWAVAISPAGWVTFVFLLLHFSWKRFGRKALGVGGIAVGLLWAFLAGRLVLTYDLADIDTVSLGTYILHNLPLVLYLCLAVCALVQLRSDWTPESKLVLLWLVVTLPYYGLYSFMDTQTVFLEPLALIVILAAVYVAGGLNQQEASRLVIGLSIGAILFLEGGRLARRSFLMPLDPRLDWQWLSPDLVLDFSKIAMGVAIIGCILSPLIILGKPTRWKLVSRVALISVIILALVDPIVTTYQDKADVIANVRASHDFLANQDLVLPVYVDSPETADYFAYVSRYKGQAAQVLPDNALVEEGYIVLPYYSNIEPQVHWWPLQQVGAPGQGTFWVYRTLLPENARLAFDAAKMAVNAGSDAKDYWNLYGTAVNAGEFCEAYGAWVKYVKFSASDEIQFIPVNKAAPCFDLSAEMLKETAVQHPIRYWQTQQGTVWDYVAGDSQRAIAVLEPTVRTAIFRNIELESNRIYYFEITLNSDVPTVILLLRDGAKEQYTSARAVYNTTNTASIIFAAPKWNEPTKLVTISPLIFLDVGTVEIIDVSLHRVEGIIFE